LGGSASGVFFPDPRQISGKRQSLEVAAKELFPIDGGLESGDPAGGPTTHSFLDGQSRYVPEGSRPNGYHLEVPEDQEGR
jgi:hypothetical protein